MKNVARHTIIYALSDFLRNGISFFMIPLYTYYLTTENYGTLELLDLTGYVVGLLLAMGISQSMIRFYYEYPDEKSKNLVISVSQITIWCVVGFFTVALLFFSRTVSVIVFEKPDLYSFFQILFITLALQLSNNVPLTLIRIKQKSVLYALVSLARSIITIALNILFIVHYGMGIMGILISSLVATGITGIFLMVYVIKNIRLQYSFTVLKRMLMYSLPLMGSWFGMFVLNFGDRFIIQRVTSLSDVGIYSLSYKFGIILNVLVLTPFLMMWEPKRFDLLQEENARNIYSRIFTYFLFVEVFLALGIGILIKDVIQVMAEAKFHDAYRYVPLILAAYVFYGAYSYLQFGIHVAKKTKHLAIATIAAAAINVASNLILIPLIDIWGAAISTTIAFAFLVIYIYHPAQKLYHVPYEWARIVKMTGVALGLLLISYMINIPQIALSIAVKFLLALTYPVILYLIGFFKEEEIRKFIELKNLVFIKFKRVPDVE